MIYEKANEDLKELQEHRNKLATMTQKQYYEKYKRERAAALWLMLPDIRQRHVNELAEQLDTLTMHTTYDIRNTGSRKQPGSNQELERIAIQRAKVTERIKKHITEIKTVERLRNELLKELNETDKRAADYIRRRFIEQSTIKPNEYLITETSSYHHMVYAYMVKHRQVKRVQQWLY